MRAQSTRSSAILRCGVAMGALLLPVSAMAQNAADDAEIDNSEIVVTGTLIRGTEVVGSQTITVDATAIADKAAGSTNELLSLIPQISNTFNGRFEGDPRGIRAGISINRPNLRNLPGFNQATGGVTLVLMDGMRLTPVGVGQSATDVDVIPSAVLTAIDVVTDGGTSLYGADAVAGVLNFRTMKEYDGLKVDGNFGLGDTISGYKQWDASITAGTSWNSGNAYISVTHAKRDAILNGETPWASGVIFDPDGNGSFASTQCIDPVGSEVRYFKFGEGLAQWTSNPAAPGAGRFPIGSPCDQVASQTYLPKQERTSVFGSLSQELADNIDLRMVGYWTKRDTTIFNYPAGSSTTDAVFVPPASNPPPGTVVSSPGGTGFSYGANSAYVNRPNRLGYETWGIRPELTAKLSGGWQLRTSLHYGQSSNFQVFTGADNALAVSYVNAGQLDPLNVGAASAAVINDITDFQNDQETNQTFFMFRSIVDGTLFTLPGGDVKVAVGIEYQDTNVETRLNAGKAGTLASVAFIKASASAKSVFGEVTVPVTKFLDINGSFRFDDYSNFGSTGNPNIGFALKPTEWLKVYGHWNTSFNAPTALDALAVSTGRFACPYSDAAGSTSRPNNSTGRDNGMGQCALVLQGSAPGVQPQTAKSWAVGFEATPLSGLRFGAQFYSIDFNNILGAIDSQRDSSYSARPDLFIYNADLLSDPSILSGLYSQLANGDAISTQQPLENLALVADLRTTNLSNAKIEGIDFHVYYNTDTSFGQLAFGVSGNLVTKAERDIAGLIINDRGNGSSEFTASTSLGWNNNGFSARVTVNYSGKYTDDSTNFLGDLDPIDPFTMVNLNLGYDFGDSDGPLSGTKLRVSVDNLFDKQPQRIQRANTNSLSYEHWTLGRVFKFGISKEF